MFSHDGMFAMLVLLASRLSRDLRQPNTQARCVVGAGTQKGRSKLWRRLWRTWLALDGAPEAFREEGSRWQEADKETKVNPNPKLQQLL